MVAAHTSSRDTMVKYLHDNRTKFEKAKALGKEKEIRQLIDTYRSQRDLDSIMSRDNDVEILKLEVFHRKHPLTADPNQFSNAWQQIRNVNLIFNRLTEKLATVQSYFQYILPNPSSYPVRTEPLNISPLFHESDMDVENGAGSDSAGGGGAGGEINDGNQEDGVGGGAEVENERVEGEVRNEVEEDASNEEVNEREGLVAELTLKMQTLQYERIMTSLVSRVHAPEENVI
ncbi:hypothetical protein HDU76_009667 [Blyttiomyces sp. JEL0837]|nr:hypothetical protein HDU76_009667 [Blyttiomyces sp. JEL0837]